MGRQINPWMTAGALACASAGVLAYGARGKSSTLFGPSVYHGTADRPSLALTFDDGPSPSTPRLLQILEMHRVQATFFQCGANVRRDPGLTRAVAASGHEIGNHSNTHPLLSLQPQEFIQGELQGAQDAIQAASGTLPSLFRAPYGVRWFGLREVQKRLGLLGVMWTVIGLDWKLGVAGISDRILNGARNGAIICLHDGRELAANPDVSNTIEALRYVVPELLSRGFQFETVTQILCPNPSSTV
ncbi:MAG TPA: polysaccharide deacetylase family protein [Bryobacteraceae bacterium]|nr:polysaccharide deacetylase family protein [Bryobacteraceae bacterium]